MGLDAMDFLAGVGGGLEGYIRYKTLDEEQKRRKDELERQKKRDEEYNEDRAERAASRKSREQQERERLADKALNEITTYYAKKGIVLSPEKARQYVATRGLPRSQAVDVGIGGVADLAMNALGDAGRGLGDRFGREGAEALRRSAAAGGSIEDLPDGLGYARDENAAASALRRAEAAERAAAAAQARREADEREARTRELVARIAAASRGAGSGRSELNAQINDQEQTLAAATKGIPTTRPPMARVLPGGDAVDPALAAQFVSDSTKAAEVAENERKKLDALKVLRGDFTAMDRGTPSIPGTGAPAPAAAPTMPPQVQQQMAGELAAVSQRVQRILTNPRATPQDKAVARAELERRQREIVSRYQGATR